MAQPARTYDPITLEVLSNSLRSVTDETFVALMKSAYSSNIKERHDHSTAIFDAQGRLIMQARQSLPIHVGSMTGTVRGVLSKYDDIAPEDIYIANDPYAALGTHLPDINVVTPVFFEGKLLAFSCNIAHHADVGGMTPGSSGGGMSEIYQEGIRIPVTRLFRQGTLDADLLELLLLNVRGPEERRGDYLAQAAACRLGAERLIEIAGHYGADFLAGAFDETRARTEQRIRRALVAIPDGSYEFSDVMDDDGLDARNVLIKLKITKKGETILFDFAGTSPQVPGNINIMLHDTISSCCYALKALLDPAVSSNQGLVDAIEVRAEPGSLVNPRFPGTVANRSQTGQRIVDVVFGALKDCMPERALSASNGANTGAVFSGIDPRNGRQYVYLETIGGGGAARPNKDGKDGVQVNLTNTSNLPVEAIEFEYPLRVEEYSLIPDSGGAGRFRGGLGMRRVVSPVGHDSIFSGSGERFVNAPWGVFGGEPGKVGRFVRYDGEREDVLPNKPTKIIIREGQRVAMETAGGGGNGPPASRNRDLIETDLASGKYSADWIKKFYGN